MDIAATSRFFINVAAVFSTVWCFAAGSAAEGQCTKPSSSGTIHFVAQLHPEASDDNPGSVDKPFKTISRAAREVQPGDTVLIEDGVYREAVRIEASGTQEAPIVFSAALGARVVVTGTDVVTGWKKEEGEANIYSVPWTHGFLGWTKDRTHPADDYHLMIGRVEQIFVNGYSLLQVPSRSELTRGTFFVDENGKQLCVWDRTNVEITERTPRVEASVRPVIWDCTGSFVITRGIRFCRAPSAAQSGSVMLRGNGDVIENCTIEEMNGAGMSFKGDGIVARGCVIRNNGQMGFGACVKDFQMTKCVVENNNTKNELVLASAGAKVRDADDLRVIAEVKGRTGQIGRGSN